jgi:protein TonB
LDHPLVPLAIWLALSGPTSGTPELRLRPADDAWAAPLPMAAPADRARVATALATTGGDPLAHLPLRPGREVQEPLAARATPPPPPPSFKKEKVEIALPPPTIEQAETIDAPVPDYPRQAQRKRQEGTVTLLADVRADGTVDGCRVETSSGFPLLDDAALAVLPTWRFKPRIVAGAAIPFIARVPFRFVITRRG